MKKWVVLATVAILLGGFAFAAAPAHVAAQNTSGSGTAVTCDSTLVLLLMVAEKNYGYTPSAGIDISGLDYGQYGTLHSSMMGGAMATPEAGAMATQEAGMAGSTSAMMTPEVGASGTMLQPGNVAGENATCTALRADLEAFLFNQLASGSMGTGSSSSSTGGSDMSATAEATASG